MGDSLQPPPVGGTVVEQFDAIIIGAGVTGLYQLYCLRQRGLSVRVFEDGGGMGGTWYWNRYPGCRFDSESYTYGYSFSEELLQEWDWKEHYSGQPQNERYLNYVADKFDLGRDIQFDARVATGSTTSARTAGRSKRKTAVGPGRYFESRRPVICLPGIYQTLRGSIASRATGVTPPDGRRKAWI